MARVQKVSRPPGAALPDFEIFCRIARAWGCDEMFREWRTPEAVFEILKRLSRGRACDITGIRDYSALAAAGGIQWPYPVDQEDGPPATHRRLFEDGQFHRPGGRALFCFEAPRPVHEPTVYRFPFVLLTGRGSAAQWHTETRTSKSAVLRKLHPKDPYVELNPTDARRLGIAPNDWVVVRSRRGRVTVRAFLTHIVGTQQLFMPIHSETTNQLIYASFDPYSRQPSYKHCAVDVSRYQG